MNQSNNKLKRTFFVNWFAKHGRDFPWRRKNVSPFAMLVTEMLVRQTRADAVAKLWKEFTRKYPRPSALANTPHRKLVNELKMLGFGSQKAEALIAASEWLIKNHQGRVPDSLDELLRIPHIGLYASRAVLCFAFGRKIETGDTCVRSS